MCIHDWACEEDASPFWGHLEIFNIIFFTVDIALNFVTGYYDNLVLVIDRTLIIRHYLRTWSRRALADPSLCFQSESEKK